MPQIAGTLAPCSWGQRRSYVRPVGRGQKTSVWSERSERTEGLHFTADPAQGRRHSDEHACGAGAYTRGASLLRLLAREERLGADH